MTPSSKNVTSPVIVTRPLLLNDDVPDKLCALFTSHGYTVHHLPLVALHTLGTPEPKNNPDDTQTSDYNWNWLIFTSPKAVQLFFNTPISTTLFKQPSPPRIAAVGSATKSALEQKHHVIEVMPEEFVSDNLATNLLKHLESASPQHLLWPCNASHDDTLPQAFEASPHTLTPWPLYHSQPQAELSEEAQEQWNTLLSIPDTQIVFTSPSAVRGAKQCGLQLTQHPILSIGPKTSQALREHCSITSEYLTQAPIHSFDGLLEALNTSLSIQ